MMTLKRFLGTKGLSLAAFSPKKRDVGSDRLD